MHKRLLLLTGIVACTISFSSAKDLTISPSEDLATAMESLIAGDVLILQNGTYNVNRTINLSQKGIESSLITIKVVDGAKPVLDYSKQPLADASRGILLTGDYYYILGLEICWAGDNGIKIEGSHNTIERCVLHHNFDSGIQLGFGHKFSDTHPGISENDGSYCSYNLIKNCDSYLNYDVTGQGGNADGFACKMHNGKGNVFYGCRSWRNSDDGWDLYETDFAVEIISCWTWFNGHDEDFTENIAVGKVRANKSSLSVQGNGNGIKLGGNGTGGSSKGIHVVKNCISFGNNISSSVKGFDQNSHSGGVIIYNCLGFNNGYNFMFETSGNPAAIFKNNVTIKFPKLNNYEFASNSVLSNNSWDLTNITADTNDYISLSETDAKAPRQANGSLPTNNFARLKTGSDLIDKGVNVGLPYAGSAPDIGPFEYGTVGVTKLPVRQLKTSASIKAKKIVLLNGNKSLDNSYDTYTIEGKLVKKNMHSLMKNMFTQGVYILKKKGI